VVDVQWLQMARPDMVSVILVTLLQLGRSLEIATAKNLPDQSPHPTPTNNAIVFSSRTTQLTPFK